MSLSLAAAVAGLLVAPNDSTTGFARFAGNSRIEIAKSAKMLDLRKDFTIEIWTRFQKSIQDQYFAGNEAWPRMSPRVKVAYNCGWVLRKRRQRDFRGRPSKRGADRLEFTFGTLQGGWTTLSYKFKPSGAALHLAVCRKGDWLTMSANGQPVARKNLRGVSVVMSPTPIYLGGRRYAPADRKFRGDIQAFRISDKSRYGTSRFKPPISLKADKHCLVLYDFRQQSDKTKAVDLSEHKRHGTLNNVFLQVSAGTETAKKKPTDRLPQQGRLKRNETLFSKNGKFYLRLDGNGNLVLRRTADNKVLWHTPIRATQGRGMVLNHQADGNLIVQDKNDRPLWTTRTSGHKGTVLVVQDNGRLVLSKGMGKDRRVLWANRRKRR